MLNHIMHSNQQVVTHPVEHIPASVLSALPELPMTQSADGTYFCDGESTQDGTPSPDNPIPITNTYPAGTYKAVCGDKMYKVVLDDDLRSVPGVSDMVVIDAAKGMMRVERKIDTVRIYGTKGIWLEDYIYYANKIPFGILKEVSEAKRPYCTHFSFALKEKETVTVNNFTNSGDGLFEIRNDVFESLDALKTFFDENEVIVQYILTTPTTHQSIPTQLVTISTGQSVQIVNTVNDKVDYLAVKGDSWQLMQNKIVDEDGNVTQPAMPSPEYPSEIVSVGGKMVSTNNCLGGKDKLRGNSITLPTLRGLPDGTRDVLYVDRKAKRAWVERKVGHEILDGTELWGTSYWSKMCVNQNELRKAVKGTAYSTHFHHTDTINTYADRENAVFAEGQAIGFGYDGDVDAFKTFLQNQYANGTPLTAIYALAEPVIEELPYSDYLLEMCQYETNINFADCNENLIPKIEVGCKVLGR